MALLSLEGGAIARAEDAGWGAFTPSINDYGTTGLVQMPNGRMSPDGSFAFGFSRSDPYTRFFLTSQFLPWLQGTFRYTDISYASYGIVDTQSYKDKAVDLKIRLLQEGPRNPEVSVGFRDIGGTGVFSSEYLAASRRYYGLDFTGGIAWGNMGSRGQLPNPFGLIIDKAKIRPSTDTTGTPGALSTSFFRGENIGLFGGVEWQTPLDGVRLKAEYDSNSYQQEFQNTQLDVTSPINVSISYQPFPWIDLSLGYERGNTLMFRGALVSDFNSDTGVPKIDEAPPLPVDKADRAPSAKDARTPKSGTATSDNPPEMSVVDASVDRLFDSMQQHGVVASSVDLVSPVVTIHLDRQSSQNEDDLAAVALSVAQMPTVSGIETVAFRAADGSLAASLDTNHLLQQKSSYGALPGKPAPLNEREMGETLFKTLEYYDFKGRLFGISGHRATVVYSQGAYKNATIGFGRVARAVALVTPASVTEFDLIEENVGVPIARVIFQRQDVLKAALGQQSVDELWINSQSPIPAIPQGISFIENKGLYPAFSWGLSPNLRQNVGGPNNFYMYQIYGSLAAKLQLTQHLSVGGSAGVNLLNNYDNFTYDAPSNLPRVRTDIRSYLIEKDYWLDKLHADYVTTLGPNLYGRVSAGIFELMYGGIDGEVLYRPQGKRWALGLDVNHVWQRDFDGMLGFKSYDITTGHLTWYQTLPFKGLEGSLSLGRYLAGDVGATLSLARRFENGMRIGAWATKTNVSSEDFGEGSFDKGFYVVIPFNLFTTKSTKSTGSLAFRPLTRDGGARVDLPMELYAITGNGGISTEGWQDSLK